VFCRHERIDTIALALLERSPSGILRHVERRARSRSGATANTGRKATTQAYPGEADTLLVLDRIGSAHCLPC
jgi:hypothetical protein